jgi:anti-sigma-K factor RskA
MIILLVVVVVVLILAYNSKKTKGPSQLMVAEVALNNSQVTMVKQHRLNLLILIRY